MEQSNSDGEKDDELLTTRQLINNQHQFNLRV